MADVFLSYKREDLARARDIAEDIEAEGCSVFFDVKIPVGDSWDEVIERQLGQAKAVVVLWSPSSRDSQWVRREAREAEKRRILCPAFIARCDVPIEFSDLQAANLIARRSGDLSHPEWRRLMVAIKQCVASGPPFAMLGSATRSSRAMPARSGGGRTSAIAAGVLVVLALGGGGAAYMAMNQPEREKPMQQTAVSPEDVRIQVDIAGQVSWWNTPVTSEELAMRFAQLAPITPQPSVILTADPASEYFHADAVHEELQKAGIRLVKFLPSELIMVTPVPPPPDAPPPASDTLDPIIVIVDFDGSLYWNGARVSEAELQVNLQVASRRSIPPVITLDPHRLAKYSVVDNVHRLAHEAGLKVNRARAVLPDFVFDTPH